MINKICILGIVKKINLTGNQFYFALLGELYTDTDSEKSKLNFEKALLLTRTTSDKHAIQTKIDLISMS